MRQVADGMREAKAAGKKVLWVGGPGVVHTGAAPAMVAMVEAGFVDVLFAGNALATHDIESSLYGTSLGVDLAMGRGVEHGHEHHIRALNTIRKEGSIQAAVDNGVLTGGIMHALVTHEQGVRAGRLGPRRRPAPRRLHRRHRGPAGDARRADRRRLLPDGRDHAALGRDRQHPARLDPAGLRRHQPGDRHQAGRPRLVAGARHRHRRRAVPRAARASSSSPTTAAPDPTPPVRQQVGGADQRRPPGRARPASTRRHDAVPGADQRPCPARRGPGSSSRSPAADTPPPTTITRGRRRPRGWPARRRASRRPRRTPPGRPGRPSRPPR